MEFEWKIFPGFTTMGILNQIQQMMGELQCEPENHTGRIIFMSMFNGISCGTKDNERECLVNAKVVSLYAKRFGVGQWSFIGPGSEKKWYSISEDSPQGIWDKIAERMLLEFAESGCPIFRATSPFIVQRSTQKQRSWKNVDTLFSRFGVFSDSVLCLGKMNENPQSNIAWEDGFTWFKSSSEYTTLDRIDCEPMEFEWIFLPRIHHIAACP